MFTKRRPGFTLIDLLVVIAVIVILAAILLPVFASARHRARMTACASNLHQISLALHQYAADNDGSYPIDDLGIDGNTHLHRVWPLLTPYTHNMDVFHCPEAWGPYDTAVGYDYHGGSQTFIELAKIPLLFNLPRPVSGAVVAYCTAHTRRLGPDFWATDSQGRFIGPLTIVREDGSTSQIQGDRVEHWVYHHDLWTLLPSRGLPQVGDFVQERFPGEEWPPQD